MSLRRLASLGLLLLAACGSDSHQDVAGLASRLRSSADSSGVVAELRLLSGEQFSRLAVDLTESTDDARRSLPVLLESIEGMDLARAECRTRRDFVVSVLLGTSASEEVVTRALGMVRRSPRVLSPLLGARLHELESSDRRLAALRVVRRAPETWTHLLCDLFTSIDLSLPGEDYALVKEILHRSSRLAGFTDSLRACLSRMSADEIGVALLAAGSSDPTRVCPSLFLELSRDCDNEVRLRLLKAIDHPRFGGREWREVLQQVAADTTDARVRAKANELAQSLD